MTYFLVSHELMEKTVNYLAAKPYAEVHELIQALLQCPAVVPDSAEEGTPPAEEQHDANAG